MPARIAERESSGIPRGVPMAATPKYVHSVLNDNMRPILFSLINFETSLFNLLALTKKRAFSSKQENSAGLSALVFGRFDETIFYKVWSD